MPVRVFYDKDGDLNLLKGKKIAILGYGSQGHAHALNLKDSGLDVGVGLYPGSKTWKVAEEDGLRVMRTDGSVAAATCSGSDGRFSVPVAAGRYTVEATSASAHSGCRPSDVTVPPGAYADVTVSCDTGIR